MRPADGNAINPIMPDTVFPSSQRSTTPVRRSPDTRERYLTVSRRYRRSDAVAPRTIVTILVLLQTIALVERHRHEKGMPVEQPGRSICPTSVGTSIRGSLFSGVTEQRDWRKTGPSPSCPDLWLSRLDDHQNTPILSGVAGRVLGPACTVVAEWRSNVVGVRRSGADWAPFQWQ